jgi:hypothetical protein
VAITPFGRFQGWDRVREEIYIKFLQQALSERSARDLYGPGGAVERAVTQAWDAVGVTNTSSFASAIIRLPTLGESIPGDEGRTFYYTPVTMTGTGQYQAVLNWTHGSIDLDLMIGRPGCFSHSCMLSRADGSTTRPETVCLNVRSGEQYNIIVQNFSTRSASVQVTQTIDPNPSGSCTVAGQPVVPHDTGEQKTGGNSTLPAVRFN